MQSLVVAMQIFVKTLISKTIGLAMTHFCWKAAGGQQDSFQLQHSKGVHSLPWYIILIVVL
jgi:hypothetical protein